MDLGWKSAIVLVLMIAVGVLMIVARRRNYDGVRRHYTTRRTRVPVPMREPRPGDLGEPKAPSDDPPSPPT